MDTMDLNSLERELAACEACPFRQEAIAPVGWFGNPVSPIVFVGEGPRRLSGLDGAAMASAALCFFTL